MECLSCIAGVHVQSPPLSLVDLFPTILPESRRAPIKEKIKLMPDGRWKMPLKITPDGTVGVQDQRCPQCHRKLRKYGYIERKKVHVPPQFQALSPRITRFERYFCPEHGEIFINHEALVTQHGQYHEIYMRRSRLLYAIGLTPNKIHLIFLAIDQLYIPENTILTWIWEMHVELPLLLAPAEMPCSGYLMYDEIHLRLEHHKQYAQILMDGYFGFIINVCVAAELSKETVTQFFLKNVIEPILPCISVTTDDHSTYGGVFKAAPFTFIIRQLDLSHTKRRIRENVEKAARKVNKELNINSHAYEFLIQASYCAVEAQSEAEFEWRMDVIQSLAILEKYPKLTKFFAQLREDKDLLLAHLKNSDVPLSSSPMESVNNEMEGYKALKWDLKNPLRAEFVLQARGSIRNSRCIPRVEAQLIRREEACNNLEANGGSSSQIDTDRYHLKWLRQKLKKYKEKLKQFWEKYYPQGSFEAFQLAWT